MPTSNDVCARERTRDTLNGTGALMDAYAVFTRTSLDDFTGHADGYLPHNFVGPFPDVDAAHAWASEHEGVVIGICNPVELSDVAPGYRDNGSFVSLWSGRYGTIGLIGPFSTHADARHYEYSDSLTGTGDLSSVIELCHPDDVVAHGS